MHHDDRARSKSSASSATSAPPTSSTDGTVTDALSDALMILYRRLQATAEIGTVQQTYRDITAGGYGLEVVQAVLDAWPLEHEGRLWPAWAELKRALDAEALPRALPAPSPQARPHTLPEERCNRLGLTAKRMSTLGVGQWKKILNEDDRRRRHHEAPLGDDEVLSAFQRLEQGRRPFDQEQTNV